MVALALVATSSDAVLSAKRLAASCALSAGAAAGSVFGATEYFGSTKAKSVGLSVVAVGAGVAVGAVAAGTGVAGIEGAGAEASISFGSGLAAGLVADADSWRAPASAILSTKPPCATFTSSC